MKKPAKNRGWKICKFLSSRKSASWLILTSVSPRGRVKNKKSHVGLVYVYLLPSLPPRHMTRRRGFSFTLFHSLLFFLFSVLQVRFACSIDCWGVGGGAKSIRQKKTLYTSLYSCPMLESLL